MMKNLLSVLPAASRTWTTKPKEPSRVGVPEMTPAEVMVRPGGRLLATSSE